MEQAEFRFYSSLNDFLPLAKRQVWFTHYFPERSSIKDMIEALGVPHPEVDLILVNGQSVDFSYLVQAGDRISVYPVFVQPPIEAISYVRPTPLERMRFAIDIHLGKLATYLRLLGFDVWYRNDAPDEELAQVSSEEQRVLLTQDRGLLKRRIVTYGYFVRSQYPEEQVREVLQRYELHSQIAPMTRCLRCNGELKPVAKEAVESQLPPFTRQFYDVFVQCQQCGQVYWQGAHYNRLQKLVQGFANL